MFRSLIVASLVGLLVLAGRPSSAACDPLAESYRLQTAKDLDGAIQAMRAAAAAKPSSYFPRLRIAYLSTLTGEWAAAAEAYAAAAALAPEAIEPLLGQQLALVTLGKWSAADTVGKRLLKLDPMSYLGRSRLAWTRYNQKDYRGAAELYVSVLAQYPSDFDLRVGLGWSLLLLGRREEATSAFGEVLSMQPGHAGATAGLSAATKAR
jgi:protein O-GlcNAc transferase